MNLNEQQEEEQEVLASIYEDDECFKSGEKDGLASYQYKFESENKNHSILLEVICPKNYPDEVPTLSLDLFYNNHVLPAVKKDILSKINEVCLENLGDAMIFSMIDYVKENQEDLMANQDAKFQDEVEEEEEDKEVVEAKITVRKEQLTKAQKRKLADRVNVYGERQRGHDWVDLIKHLSQNGRTAGD